MRLRGAQLVNRRRGLVKCAAENVGEVGEKEGDEGCGDVERGSEDNTDVADSHFVDSGIVDNFDEEGGQSSQELKVGVGKLVDQDVEGLDLFVAFIHIWVRLVFEKEGS